MSTGPSPRIHSMDALRASTMMLLVPVHAASLLAINGHPGGWATAIYWFVHVFRLPLFFAMSGFFLAFLLSRKGLRQTARNRTLRIAVPLLLGMVTLVPLMVFAADQSGAAIDPAASETSTRAFAFEPSFLWFLWYLLIIDGAAIAAFLLAPDLLRRAGERFRSLLARPLSGILLLAALTALALWPALTWVAAPPANTFVPEVPALVYYLFFFGLGATLCAHRDLVESASRHAWRWAFCALAAIVPAALLYSFHNSDSHSTQPLVHGSALLVYAIATWTSLLALVGFANRYMDRPRPALRYLADSSYWIYLSHLPAMVCVVGLLGATTLGAGPKFLLVTSASLAFSLITYPLFVRYTAIGRLLNGPRTRSRGAGSKPALRGASG